MAPGSAQTPSCAGVHGVAWPEIPILARVS